MLFHEELFTRSTCNSCQQEISKFGVECLECQSSNLRLCIECFGLGAEIGQHKADHKYRFFDSGSLVLSLRPSSEPPPQSTTPGLKWTAREEIRLLDAIEQYGFGNWQDISKHIETKTPSEAKVEYVNRYVVGALGELTWSVDIPNDATRNICNANLQKPLDHTIPCDEGPLSPSLTQRLPPLEIALDEMLQLGYMPNRDDYEKEYDNEAEQLISQICFLQEDEEIDVGIKLLMVDIYIRRLRERVRRKRVIRDFQLVVKFFHDLKSKSSNTTSNSSEWNTNTEIVCKAQLVKFEKSFKDALASFKQFYNRREFDNFVTNMSKEIELKFRMNELFKYRSNGIKLPEECCDYERAKGGAGILRGKRSLETIMESGSQQQGRSGSKKPHLEKFAAPLLVRQLQLAVPQSTPKLASSAMTTSIGKDESVGGSPSAVRSLTQQLSFSDGTNSKSYMELKESERALYPQGLEEPKATELMEVLTQTTNENSYQQKEKLKVSVDQFTVDYVPSADLLTESEFQFCLKLKLTPAQFLTTKTSLLLARKPKTNKKTDEFREIPCPPSFLQDDWIQVLSFLKHNNS